MIRNLAFVYLVTYDLDLCDIDLEHCDFDQRSHINKNVKIVNS